MSSSLPAGVVRADRAVRSRGGVGRALTPLPLLLVIFALALRTAVTASASGDDAGSIRLAAGWLDTVLADVARSAEAVGAEYAHVAVEPPANGEAGAAAWIARAATRDGTTGFRTWGEGDEPAAESAHASIYRYGETELTSPIVDQLNDLSALVSVVRSAYESFDFSWVYITTPDELMLIYPYVPLAEATNNNPPSEQIYYTAANTGERTIGWTQPYFDLVGAGMMVTASSPIFDGDELIGVASRDITLSELSDFVLGELERSAGATALLVDNRGLAISASDDALEGEIDAVNRAAEAAVLFYRSAQGLASVAGPSDRASTFGWANDVVERMLAAEPSGAGDVREFSIGGRDVVGTQLASTGWYLILVHDAP